jgi:hypothetical protein
MHGFVIGYIDHLETLDSLSYAALSTFDTFHYAVSKQHELVSLLTSSKKSLRFGNWCAHCSRKKYSKILIFA